MTALQARDEVDAQLLFREATAEDGPFILNSWLRSYLKRSNELRNVPGLVYWEYQPDAIKRLLTRSQVLLACDVSGPDEIFGFLVFEDIAGACVLHYAYVKSGYRRWGVFRRLLKAARTLTPGALFHTHQTDIGGQLAKKYGSTFNPYLVR